MAAKQRRPVILNLNDNGAARNATTRTLREGVVVDLANHALLIARDRTERPIAGTGAPILDDQGAVREQ